MVIAIALLLFVIAAFAGPPETPPAPVPVAPSASASPTPAAPEASASPSAGPSDAPQTPTPVASPVGTVDQILAEEVGQYMLVDRRPAEAGAQGGALEAVELRYALARPRADTDIYHAIEVHLDSAAAERRVRTFAKNMATSGFEVEREQPLRGEDGERQGYFVSLRGTGQSLLLWSNQNVTFSLSGGQGADVEAFYGSLPY